EFRASAPSSGRFAATFSPLGRRDKRWRWRSPLPLGRGRIAPNCPSQFRLAIRVRGRRSSPPETADRARLHVVAA
ncbi:MAG: hypothetical protein E5V63_35345, partial [Mesorhizobium sp.]